MFRKGDLVYYNAITYSDGQHPVGVIAALASELATLPMDYFKVKWIHTTIRARDWDKSIIVPPVSYHQSTTVLSILAKAQKPESTNKQT